MQKIQMITYKGDESKYISDESVLVSKMSAPRVFDDFDVNIIDLNENDIWLNESENNDSINSIDDFDTLGDMIEGNKSSKIVIILPSNLEYKYNCKPQSKLRSDGFTNLRSTYDYSNNCKLKDMVEELSEMMCCLTENFKIIDLIFGITETSIGNFDIPADFSISNFQGHVLTSSKLSEKITTVEIDNIYFTTLNLTTFEKIRAFLDKIGLEDKKEVIPKWMGEIQMFDDGRQYEIIGKQKAIIAEREKDIANAEAALEKNRRYKSILYTQSNELVDVVFEILNEMVGFDFSDFVDEKKEDFRCEKNGYVFIGEIKGVTSNIKSGHVSQLDVHYQSYIEDNPDVEDKTKAILVMNYQRNKPVCDRDEVHENQIKLAERNRSLIIDTFTLLKMFEKFKKGELGQAQCLEMLKDNTGLLKI